MEGKINVKTVFFSYLACSLTTNVYSDGLFSRAIAFGLSLIVFTWSYRVVELSGFISSTFRPLFRARSTREPKHLQPRKQALEDIDRI